MTRAMPSVISIAPNSDNPIAAACPCDGIGTCGMNRFDQASIHLSIYFLCKDVESKRQLPRGRRTDSKSVVFYDKNDWKRLLYSERDGFEKLALLRRAVAY